MNLRDSIDQRPMSAYQWLVVGLCGLLNALDGYDVLSMAFTGSAVSREFGLMGSQLGVLLSAGLVGMAVGSLVIGPLADRFGRRPLLLISLVINGLGMGLSSTVSSHWELGLWRVVTGIGVGGILACTAVIVSEYANNARRGISISIFTAGYGVGATLGGLGAAQLIPTFGWRSVFLVGAICTVVVIALVWALLPESVDYLATRRNPRADELAAKVARKLGISQGIELPSLAPQDRSAPGADGAEPSEQPHPAGVLSSKYLVQSLLLWASWFIVMFGFYFANTWTPALLVESGMTQQQGIVGGIMLTLGGTFGALLYGALTTRWSEKSVLMVFIILQSITLVLFITTTSVPAVAFTSGILVGMLVNGCIAGMYTLSPMTYEPALRATGVGWGIGVGRFGAILAPLTVGFLLDGGWSPVFLYVAVAVVVLLAAVALSRLQVVRRQGVETADSH
ncbi:MFS transporter [Kocuria sp.]|uniref:MFS transporter n=1 Tax=Kocuria sp. TaxID=1871328 RepID=UPI0026E0A517|nr:MFS transporter [Kocuria sp.]MDO5617773.1 MFS transporter [Kocuria sp.]